MLSTKNKFLCIGNQTSTIAQFFNLKSYAKRHLFSIQVSLRWQVKEADTKVDQRIEFRLDLPLLLFSFNQKAFILHWGKCIL